MSLAAVEGGLSRSLCSNMRQHRPQMIIHAVQLTIGVKEVARKLLEVVVLKESINCQCSRVEMQRDSVRRFTMGRKNEASSVVRLLSAKILHIQQINVVREKTDRCSTATKSSLRPSGRVSSWLLPRSLRDNQQTPCVEHKQNGKIMDTTEKICRNCGKCSVEGTELGRVGWQTAGQKVKAGTEYCRVEAITKNTCIQVKTTYMR
jgi:hypothetical protein